MNKLKDEDLIVIKVNHNEKNRKSTIFLDNVANTKNNIAIASDMIEAIVGVLCNKYKADKNSERIKYKENLINEQY